MAITAQDRRQLRDFWRKLFREIGPDIERVLEQRIANGLGDEPVNGPATIVSQNMLRVCLEEAIGESSRGLLTSPAQAESFLAELGLRLAAYCVSAAPLEHQAEMVEGIVQGLPACVKNMRAQGFVIRCEWNWGRGWESNLPAGAMQ